MRKKFTTTLDEELIKKIKMLAIQENTDASKLLDEAIKDLLKKREK